VEGAEVVGRLPVFDAQVMLVQRYDDIRPGLKQVDRLDEATLTFITSSRSEAINLRVVANMEGVPKLI
jgi:hypothetical protein